MSTENEEKKEENKINENNIDYVNLDKNILIKQNPFVKDLLFKLDVLKKVLLKKKRKHQHYYLQ